MIGVVTGPQYLPTTLRDTSNGLPGFLSVMVVASFDLPFCDAA